MNKSNDINIVKSQNAGEIIFELTEQNKEDVSKLRNFDLVYFLCPQCSQHTDRPVPYYRYKVGLPVCYSCRKENMKKKISESEIKARNKSKEKLFLNNRVGEIIIDLNTFDKTKFSQIRAFDKVSFTCKECFNTIITEYCNFKKYYKMLYCKQCKNKNKINSRLEKLNDEVFLKNANEAKELQARQKIWFYCQKCNREVHRKRQHFNYKLLCEQCNTIVTTQERFGVDNVFQLSRVRESAQKAFQENKEEIIEKRRANAMAKYGIPNAANTPEAMAKYKATCMEKYGCLPIHSEASKKKSSTNLFRTLWR